MTSPLSQAQLSIFLACQGQDAQSGNYQIPFLYRLPKETDLRKLCRALEAFVAAHPYILSRLVEEDGIPRMQAAGEKHWEVTVTETDSIEKYRVGFGRPMDLYKEPLFRLELYKTPDGNYLYMDFHHILFDGASGAVFSKALTEAYDGKEIDAESITGAEIALQEEELRSGKEYEEAKAWFEKTFSPAAEVESRIIPDVFGKAPEAYRPLLVDLGMDHKAVQALRERFGCPESVLFNTAFGLTLAAWNADTCAAFSTIWNGRKDAAWQNTVTMCVHTQPVYVESRPEMPLGELIDQMKAQSKGLRENDCYSYSDCLKDLGLNLPVNFAYQGRIQPNPMPLTLGGIQFYGEDLRTNPPGIGLSAELFAAAEGPYKLRFWYRPNLYSQRILENLAESFSTLVQSMAEARTVGELAVCSPSQTALLESFQPPMDQTDTSRTPVDLFREQARLHPDHTALVHKDIRLSYREADRLSDHIAAWIEERVAPGSVVSILLGRNEYTLLAPLGALKAGCAYEPLDPSYPTERLKFMMEDAKTALLIADSPLLPLVKDYQGPVLKTEEIRALPEGKPKGKPAAENLFVLLYTSGTTGTPKGCMITHRNVSAFAQRHVAYLGFNTASRLTAYASFGFDAFVGDLYGALVAGATLYIIPEEIRLDLPALNDYLEKNGITHAFMTTQVATQFALNYPSCKGLQVLSTGGEKLSSFALPHYRLFNLYGPTECICYVVGKEVTAEEPNIPIGRAIPGIHTFIVGKNGGRVPVGAAGELLITGMQVGDGYLGRPDKTAEAFGSNPFETDPAYGKLYRTGDIVRYRENGDIEFIGRKDAQVKIRGFRIELKEVETVIREFPGIRDVTVQAFDQEGGGKFLAAYVVSGEKVDTAALNAFIMERKPPYMVPAVTMQIDAIPLNVNQKVDRKALPKPQVQKAESQAAPLNVLEEALAALLKETTGIEGASLTEPLLLYGLSSLSALRLATELYKRYGVQSDMSSFAKTATLQGIENSVLEKLLQGGKAPSAEEKAEETVDQEIPLTNQQAGVYIDCVKAPHETVYNIPTLWSFPEGTDAEALREAAGKVLRAHPGINVHLAQRDGKIYSIPSREPLEVSLEAFQEPEAWERFKGEFVRPFDLDKGPLARITVARTPGGVYLLTDFHHLVFDGQSYDIFMRQLTAALEGTAPETEKYPYSRYAKDQLEAAESEAFREDQAFFARQMEGFEGATSVIPDLESAEGHGKEAYVYKKVNASVAGRCQQLGITPASYFLAAAYLTLSAFSGSRKVFMCTVSNGRSNLRTADTLGMFVNTLALSADTTPVPIDTFLKETDRNFHETLAHEDYPFSRVAADFDFQPQVMLAYEVGVLESYTVQGKPVGSEVLELESPKFPVSIFINGTEGDETIALSYDDALYSRALMERLADALECTVRGLLGQGSTAGIPLVDGERLQELDSFNHYFQEVDPHATIVSLFREQAKKTPDLQSVSFEGTQLTYAQLDALTDRIAARISAMGLGRENVVSVLIHRSHWMAAASLGILKAGCAYQPLDPSYPRERLDFMIADAGAGLLIADEDLLPLLGGYKGPVLTVGQLETLPEGPVPEGPLPESLFILLYTSGSTGVPKGCMLEHRNLTNFCAWYRNYYQLLPGCRVAAYASYGFDACMMDMYPALTSGACVCIIPEETRHDMHELDRFITSNGITHSFMTTQVGVMFAKNFPDNPSLRHLSVGGEKLVSLTPPSYGFHNGYGPTECTIFSTVFPVREKEANIPIGHPLDNVFLYVVDKEFRRLPVGAAGELIIAGEGVGRGYLNRPDKTAECFVDNPFHPGMRAYRSGDIVRFRADGNVEFVGRNDGQVKIRGFRVELKEVEAVLREMPGLKDVTVQAFDAPSGGKFIAAYVVADHPFDAKAAAAFIRDRKPPYMVPASFVQLDKIPLNVNQKVDRKALPAPTPAATEDYVAPANEMEQKLCAIFAEVLNLEKVSVVDNFFDLGGSSLLVTNVLVNAEKQQLNFAYADVFAHPTARSLAAFLGGGAATDTEDQDVVSYDYSAINKLLTGNTLEALAQGKRQSLEGQILLTGATGFLGIHVLRELLDSTSDQTVVWCLLRGKGSLTPVRRLSEMLVYYFDKDYRPLIGNRIRLVQGDITDPQVFQSLKDSGIPFSLVFNCAANVKHFSKGTDIEDINYGGVKNLVAFCESRGARLIQVSTESVAGMNLGDTPAVMNEQTLWFGQQTDNQYVHSKFMAERLILQHMAEGSLNAKILRAGNLSPRASDGEFQVNLNSNAAMGRFKAFKMLGACPYSLLEGRMEFSPVDQSARAMVLLAGTPRENCVFNVSNDHYIPMDDVLSRLEKLDGKAVEYVEFPEFSERLDKVKDDPVKARSLSSLLAYAQAPTHRESVFNQPSVQFTMQVLYRLGFRWDHTSSKYVDMIFDMLRTMRYFD